MNTIRRLTDRAEILESLGRQSGKYLFEIVDLDDLAWPHSEYFGLESGGALREVCLVYRGLDPAHVVATVNEDEAAMVELFEGILDELPPRFSASVPQAVAPVLASRFNVDERGAFQRMATAPKDWLAEVRTDDVELLSVENEREILDVVQASFTRVIMDSLAGHPRPFFGVRREGRLVSIAGETFWSPQQRVGAIGPVATHPDARGQGLATKTCARLCADFASRGARVIGLHVREGNVPAIRCYERLGFTKTAEFYHYALTEK